MEVILNKVGYIVISSLQKDLVLEMNLGSPELHWYN